MYNHQVSSIKNNHVRKGLDFLADINNLFVDFYEKISLSKEKADNLRRGRDALRKKIKEWFSDNEKGEPSFCWQGSFAMKTTVNPIGDGEYDLDDGVYLQEFFDEDMSTWPATSTVHSWIKSAVKGHTQSAPIDKDTCVRVVYAKGYHIDYPIYIKYNDTAYLAHKTKGWTISDPKAFKDWFIQNVREEGEQLRRLVKYLKAWKDFKEISLKGIEITILATENFCAYEGRDEKSLYETVQNILVVLENNFVCIKPVAPGEDLFEGTSKTKKDNIINGLKALSNKLDLAIKESDPKVASQYMKEIFGNRFPEGSSIEKSKDSTSFARTSSPGVLQHDGRSA